MTSMQPLKVVLLRPADIAPYVATMVSMIEKEDYLCTPTGRIKLTQRLSCANYGIYVATCLLWKEQYVGQTKNKFSVTWIAHRNNWHKSTGKEEGALIKHHTMKHPAISDNLPFLPNCYKVTFVEQSPCENLDWCEDKWIHRIKASINLDRMILPDTSSDFEFYF